MQKNQRVWFYRWNQLCSGEIIGNEKHNAQYGPYYEVHIKTIGNYKTGGTTGCLVSECFATKEACLAAHSRWVEDTVTQYKNSMPDAAALIQFCLNHAIACSEDCDWEARRAVLERAIELGFHVSD